MNDTAPASLNALASPRNGEARPSCILCQAKIVDSQWFCRLPQNGNGDAHAESLSILLCSPRCALRHFETLRSHGATVGDASIAHAKDIAPVYLHLVLADAAAYHAVALDRRPHAYTANVRLRLEMGRHILAEDYERALRGRAVLRRDVESALQGVDALVLPALGIEAPPIGAATVPVNGGQEPVRTAMLRCTQLFNVTSHPAISLPCGTTQSGLPIGLQIVGHPGRTGDLLRVAAAVERALFTTR